MVIGELSDRVAGPPDVAHAHAPACAGAATRKKKRLVVFERKSASGRVPRQERVRSVLPIISFPSPPPHSSRGGGWREKEREREAGWGWWWVDARLTLAREQVFWFQTKALDVRERDELGLSGGKVVPLDLHPLVRYLYVLVLVQQAHRALLYGLSDLSLGSPPPPPPHPSWKVSEKSFFTRQAREESRNPFLVASWPRKAASG